MGTIRNRIISRFIGGKLPLKFDRQIRRFVGQHHRSHCLAIFGTNHKNVHLKMDSLSKNLPGKKHRLYGHNIDFIKNKFTESAEIQAAYVHLLGDFMADILPDTLKIVLTYVNKQNVSPPSYLSFGKNHDSWDIKEQAIAALSKRIAQDIFNTLKNRKHRKVKN